VLAVVVSRMSRWAFRDRVICSYMHAAGMPLLVDALVPGLLVLRMKGLPLAIAYYKYSIEKTTKLSFLRFQRLSNIWPEHAITHCRGDRTVMNMF
jgi:hypothetical protein